MDDLNAASFMNLPWCRLHLLKHLLVSILTSRYFESPRLLSNTRQTVQQPCFACATGSVQRSRTKGLVMQGMSPTSKIWTLQWILRYDWANTYFFSVECKPGWFALGKTPVIIWSK
jgi:hypothetical protein